MPATSGVLIIHILISPPLRTLTTHVDPQSNHANYLHQSRHRAAPTRVLYLPYFPKYKYRL
ncbi:hypothetical protein L210DRAFT_2779969 [Boletus edulis BED1]|uniref:Secreted protein n=1 Tax=Boletus edulis BED1 TaxID=1328754 RepID=A0AAD4BAQ3_BOLED|nr:hypothetical protein L210DRAFT_2779969 [Boletus edulis BED1]